eukprot:TRINITY_DN3356_c1_g3_i1.p1 TRINITY_DN3356_c1_g3~~TRINITY_DN3356_c1_g3_i1.p1  ORF type:complete len:204 (+),score=20.08 TRINITY_DN3356_c1_g3_i1:1-612(+)
MSIDQHANVAKLQRCNIERSLCFVHGVVSGMHAMTRRDYNVLSPRKVLRLHARDNKTSHAAPTPLPAHANELALHELPDGISPSDTTVIVRDIPCRVGYERMMVELKHLGLDGCYDFIYFPKSLRDRKCNRGFCFINFMSPDALRRFVMQFTGYRFESIQSPKSARIGRASVQGRRATIAQLIGARNRVVFKADPAGLRAPSS